MGKGDIKSRRGKIVNKSFGKRRPRKKDSIHEPLVKPAKEKIKVEAVAAKKPTKSKVESTTTKSKSTKPAKVVE